MIKKIFILSAFAILTVSITSLLNHWNFVFGHSDGSQGPGYSASPGDGSTSCATGGCHTSSSIISGWISTNIPGTGYIPNTAYTVTLTMSGSSHAFEITSEKSGGTKVGTFSSASGVALYNSSKSAVSTTMFSSKTMTWTAPAAGTGSVTLYACFSSSQSNAKKCSLTVSENVTGLSENSDSSVFSIFPNPAQDVFEINYSIEKKSSVEINLYSMEGEKVAVLFDEDQASGNYAEQFNMKDIAAKGIYIIELKIADKSALKKLIIE